MPRKKSETTGWAGQILVVDLSTGKHEFKKLDKGKATNYLGGRGLGTAYLMDEMDPTADPLGPDNVLILATGALTGTFAPASGRYMVITKSPLTGGIACSNAGGHFGPEMKYAGIDLIMVKGKSETPVYIWIRDGEVEIRDAKDIWGMTFSEAENAIKLETSADARVSGIGPAGEKMALMACVMNDTHRAAGRSGVGAVFGSKNLKAVVVRGTGSVRVHDPEAFKRSVDQAFDGIRKNPWTGKVLGDFGTAGMVDTTNEMGLFPTNNFTRSSFEEAENINAVSINDKLMVRRRACFSCPMACTRVTKVEGGEFAGKGEGPEYEAIFGVGSACGVGDLDAVAKANYLCNEYGLDPIGAGVTIAAAMEMFEKGIITEKETGGLELKFGNAGAMVEAIRQIAYREGFGDEMAEGSMRLTKKYGHPEIFMGVKGQEFPAYEPRGAAGMGLGFATSNRGACHVRGFVFAAETAVPGRGPKTEKKAKMVIGAQNHVAAIDSLGLCLFAQGSLSDEALTGMIYGATGVKVSAEDVDISGERTWNTERAFNIAAGFTSKDDTLPDRMLEEPLEEGSAKGHVVKLDEMLPEYYELRGWTKDGEPSDEKKKQLGIK